MKRLSWINIHKESIFFESFSSYQPRLAEILENEQELFGGQVGGREASKKIIVLIVTTGVETVLREAVESMDSSK